MRTVATLIEPAQGFFDLGMFNEAWIALDDLAPEDKGTIEVIALRQDILLALHRLNDAVALGTGACRLFPKSESFFLKTASALIDLSDHQKAKLLLLAAPGGLKDEAAYFYALARCHGRLGELPEAKQCLSECIRKDKGYRQQALDESDLSGIWD